MHIHINIYKCVYMCVYVHIIYIYIYKHVAYYKCVPYQAECGFEFEERGMLSNIIG